jgi:hypothetical protein
MTVYLGFASDDPYEQRSGSGDLEVWGTRLEFVRDHLERGCALHFWPATEARVISVDEQKDALKYTTGDHKIVGSVTVPARAASVTCDTVLEIVRVGSINGKIETSDAYLVDLGNHDWRWEWSAFTELPARKVL